MTEFEVGDVVMLKSGGPNMTVSQVGDNEYGVADNTVLCIWFDKSQNLLANFDTRTLSKVELPNS